MEDWTKLQTWEFAAFQMPITKTLFNSIFIKM